MMEIIAIDFDGTLCVDKFPEIGEPNWEVINRAKAVQEAGIPTILNTCREGKLLDNAVKACARWGLKFDAVNENLPAFVAETGDNPRKIAATQYWDDKAVCMGTGPDPIPTPTPTRNNIVEKSGDVLKSGADVICHQVNCKGVMGSAPGMAATTSVRPIYFLLTRTCGSPWKNSTSSPTALARTLTAGISAIPTTLPSSTLWIWFVSGLLPKGRALWLSRMASAAVPLAVTGISCGQ